MKTEHDDLSITCPRCGATSYHPKDVEYGYCGRCHWWTSDPDLKDVYPDDDRFRRSLAPSHHRPDLKQFLLQYLWLWIVIAMFTIAWFTR